MDGNVNSASIIKASLHYYSVYLQVKCNATITGVEVISPGFFSLLSGMELFSGMTAGHF